MNYKIKYRGFKRENLQIVSLTLIFTFVIYLIYLFSFPFSNTFFSGDYLVFVFSWVGIFLLFFILVTWYKITGLILSPYTIFIGFLFLFNFGQCFMWGVGIHTSTEIGQEPIFPGFRFPNNNDIINTQIFILLSIMMFHLGAIFSPLGYSNFQYHKKEEDLYTLKAVYVTSVLISILSIPVTLYSSIQSLNIAKQYGYKALYYGELIYSASLPVFLDVFNMMFFPSLVGLLIGSKFSRKTRTFVFVVFVSYLLINLLSGDRGSWIYKLVILIWLFHKCFKPLNFRKICKQLIVFIISLYLIYGIVNLRDVGLSHLNQEMIVSAFSFEKFPLIIAIFEMGGSMKPTMMLLMYGWNVWPYENTYILALLGMVTNKVIYFLDIPFSLISTWFSQDYLGLTYGAGFSIIAEALLNFGPYIAPLFMVILGFVISSFIYVDKKMEYSKYPLRYFFVTGTLHNFLYVVRNYFHLPLKEWFYGVVLFCITILVIRSLLIKYSYKR